MEITEKKCGACLQVKDIRLFYRNSGVKSGYDKRCKMCKMQGKKCVKEVEKKIKQRVNGLGRMFPTKDDYETMFLIMKMIGYDPENVHLDFCKKYGFEPKKRLEKDKNKFTAKDFVL